MVKGTTQQVIIVRATGSELFDEAIFLVRPGAEKNAVTERMLLEEAKQAAAAGMGRDHKWLQRLAAALCGAGVLGLVWLLTALI